MNFEKLHLLGINSGGNGQNTIGGAASMSNLHFDQPKKKKRSFSGRGKGFYVAMAVCLVAIGAAAWTTLDSVSSLTEMEGGNGQTSSQNQIVVGVSSGEPTVSQPTIYAETSSTGAAQEKPGGVTAIIRPSFCGASEMRLTIQTIRIVIRVFWR